MPFLSLNLLLDFIRQAERNGDTFPELLTAGISSKAEFFNIPKITPPIGLKSRLGTTT